MSCTRTRWAWASSCPCSTSTRAPSVRPSPAVTRRVSISWRSRRTCTSRSIAPSAPGPRSGGSDRQPPARGRGAGAHGRDHRSQRLAGRRGGSDRGAAVGAAGRLRGRTWLRRPRGRLPPTPAGARRAPVKVSTRLLLLALLPGLAHGEHPALALSDAQQRAAGIRLDHPVATVNAPLVEAYGLVIDPVALVTDIGRMERTQAAWHAAQADVARLAALYRDNLNA